MASGVASRRQRLLDAGYLPEVVELYLASASPVEWSDEDQARLQKELPPPYPEIEVTDGAQMITIRPVSHAEVRQRGQLYRLAPSAVRLHRPLRARGRPTPRAPRRRARSTACARAPGREPDEPHDLANLRVRLAEVLDALEDGEKGIELAVELLLLLLEEHDEEAAA